jgi:hypothetical protein
MPRAHFYKPSAYFQHAPANQDDQQFFPSDESRQMFDLPQRSIALKNQHDSLAWFLLGDAYLKPWLRARTS